MRRRSLTLGGCGAAAACVLWWAMQRWIGPVADGTGAMGRLGLVLRWLLPAVVVLWAMLIVQMGLRFATGAFDPLTLGQPRGLAVNQRVITNTLEHGAVFAPSLLALAAYAPDRAMPQILALAVVFALGRLVFWAGYMVAPMARAPGMAASLVATLGAVGGALWAWMAG